MWEYIQSLLTGPGHVRFIVQPIVAIFFGIRDGIIDSKNDKPPFGYLLIFGGKNRRETFKEGLKQILNIYIVAVILDSIMQYLVYGFWRLQLALITGFTIVFLPYVIARGITNRILQMRKNKINSQTNNNS
jgi:hypothetical protein